MEGMQIFSAHTPKNEVVNLFKNCKISFLFCVLYFIGANFAYED